METYKGFSIEITQDEYADSPRQWDNLGIMACFHNRYNLGDKVDFKSADFDSWAEMRKHIESEGAAAILTLRLYDHSGITLYVAGEGGYMQHESWDSGQVGFIYATRAQICKEYGVKRVSKKLLEKVYGILRSEVKTYDQYLRGDVHSFSIDKDGEKVGSCSGYFGYEYCLQSAKDDIDQVHSVQAA